MADIFGSLIGGGLSMLGTYLNNQEQGKREEQAFQRQFDAQNFFNTHQIQQRVEDAKAAGIHPIYALGGPTTSAPAFNVGSRESYSSGLSEMGQGIGRAASALMDPFQKKSAELTLEGMSLDNEAKRQQLASNAGITQAKVSNGVPAPGTDRDEMDSPDAIGSPTHQGPAKGPARKFHEVLGGKLLRFPGHSDSDAIDDAYDDKVSTLQGVLGVGRDSILTAAYQGYFGNTMRNYARNLYHSGRGDLPRKPYGRPPAGIDYYSGSGGGF